MKMLSAFLFIFSSIAAFAAPKTVPKEMDLNVDSAFEAQYETEVPQLDFGYDETPQEIEKLELRPEFKYLDSEDPTRTLKEDREKEFKMKLKMGF